MSTAGDMVLDVNGHTLIVKFREDGRSLDATFVPPLPSGPGGFTIASSVPLREDEMSSIAVDVRRMAEALLLEFGPAGAPNGDA